MSVAAPFVWRCLSGSAIAPFPHPPGHRRRSPAPGSQCAEHARQLGGASPLSSLMERRISKAQGRRREAGSEGSVEQNRDPMDKNRITRLVRPDERAGNREVHTIKDLSSRFGGCAAKAVELTSGDLR